MALLCEELLQDLVFHGTHLDTSDNSEVQSHAQKDWQILGTS